MAYQQPTATQVAISTALRALSDQCDGAASRDGAGFNGRDTGFGKDLASKRPEWLTPKQLAAAYKMLRTYRRQLGELGIDYDGILDPSLDTEPELPYINPVSADAKFPPRGEPFFNPVSADVRPPASSRLEARDVPTPSASSRPEERDYHTPFEASSQPKTRDISRGVVASSRPESGDADSTAASSRPALRETEPATPIDPKSAAGVLGPGGVIAQHLPGYESREPQLDVAQLIEESILAGEHVVAEAGTGVGKSMAYLVPAILSGKRTIVSTADKSLQMQIVLKDLPFLKMVMPVPFEAVLLKGRSNYLCIHGLEQTRERIDGGMEGFGFERPESATAWPDIRDWADEERANGGDGDLEMSMIQIPPDIHEMITADSDSCIGSKCAFHKACFANQAIERAKAANIVVVNHALLMRDLELRYSSGASLLPDPSVIVIDECHTIEGIATDAFGIEITRGRWYRLEKRISRLIGQGPKEEEGNWTIRLDGITSMLDPIFIEIGERLKRAKTSAMRLGAEDDLAEPALAVIGDLHEAMRESKPNWLDDKGIEAWDKATEALLKLHIDVRKVLCEANPNSVRYAEATRGRGAYGCSLMSKPIEVADELRERLWTLSGPLDRHGEATNVSVIATSATIAASSGMEYFRKRTGCDEANDLVVGSPFDYAHQALLYIPSNVTEFAPPKFGDEAGSLQRTQRLAQEIEQLILASNGRAFVLFTSNRELNAVYEQLSPRLRDYLVLKQGEGESRPEMVRRFKEDGNAVLFGVKSFWAGVDVQGEALSMVIIDKIPFPAFGDPVMTAKAEAIKRRGGSDFGELSLPMATLDLKQGFGRLIRSKLDRGCVAILDTRIATARYGAEILRALPPAAITRSLDAVRAFYGGGRG